MANIHDASPKLIGYLYQIQCALYLLLKLNDSSAKLCIEKFDDVSLTKENVGNTYAQIKHHLDNPTLSDKSVDFWRTVNEWIDCVKKDFSLLDNTSFFIITTAKLDDSSCVKKIHQQENLDVEEIYSSLKSIAENGKDQTTNGAYYKNFLSFSEENAKRLLKRVKIIPNFPKINKIEDKILEELRYATRREYLPSLYEMLFGWWLTRMIEMLNSSVPSFLSHGELSLKINSVAEQYREDNLPIDVANKEFDDLGRSKETKKLVKQLDLIGAKTLTKRNALNNYFRASAQRSLWIRNNLLYVEELENYDDKLKAEWKESFGLMVDSLDSEDANDLKKKGYGLYKDLMMKDIRIRQRVDDAFVMRGSFHKLSNNVQIGWHPDYENLMGDDDDCVE